MIPEGGGSSQVYEVANIPWHRAWNVLVAAVGLRLGVSASHATGKRTPILLQSP